VFSFLVEVSLLDLTKKFYLSVDYAMYRK
jgi:hypothetical protein